MQKVPRAKFTFGARESTIGLDQKLYEKMTASIRNVKLCDREDYVEDQKLSLKTKKNN